MFRKRISPGDAPASASLCADGGRIGDDQRLRAVPQRGQAECDGTIGNCTSCHTRHTSSVRIARLPCTCGQCHMGPDHSQIEIYEESKHGVMFQAQEHLLNLDAPPKR